MHIYAFGSLCRGDVDFHSDIDMLAITNGKSNLNPEKFSIYTYAKIEALWLEGNPFAWHLYLESKMVFSEDGNDFINFLGTPKSYKMSFEDCNKFKEIFKNTTKSLQQNKDSLIFDLSSVFLAIRNFATCFSLGCLEQPIFSRNSAVMLEEFSLPIRKEAYELLERARILSTRGDGEYPLEENIQLAIESFTIIENWMIDLMKIIRVHHHE